jgi:hypothetical protein
MGDGWTKWFAQGQKTTFTPVAVSPVFDIDDIDVFILLYNKHPPSLLYPFYEKYVKIYVASLRLAMPAQRASRIFMTSGMSP